ncbi:MAG TPA: AAA family ATPase [Anaeromyxobacteraceae bacterium]|nr:AAA family ATPase [Anaeromyxobacteraceae bacterium]
MDDSPRQGQSALPGRDRLAALLAALESGLLERRTAVRLTLLAALAGEHTLLVGPPGTAKSQLARRLHLAFRDGAYFERLLTRYTVPEELFGPLSISALEEDRYERQTAGFLPQATIAFIDEVFKANSAILNALLTLLNEREFDNGPRREPCPLVSVIGATNEIPEDEVGEAFLDRFLIRLPVAPVTPQAFRRLLDLDPREPPSAGELLHQSDREAIASAALEVRLPEEVAGVLGELRAVLAGERTYVSDRRWVKITWLLKVAAASEGRAAVSLWDLWLLPWCTAPDAARQAGVASWLASRLGLGEAMSPPRLTRVVEAFEAQVEAEHAADDLDYDEGGRLRLGGGLADRVGDVKGGAAAMRMASGRRRRYGATHVGARLEQVDDLLRRIDEYLLELSARGADLAAWRARSLWADEALARRGDENLAAAVEAVRALRLRALRAREGFEALPRLPVDPGLAPPPVEHEPLAT